MVPERFPGLRTHRAIVLQPPRASWAILKPGSPLGEGGPGAPPAGMQSECSHVSNGSPVLGVRLVCAVEIVCMGPSSRPLSKLRIIFTVLGKNPTCRSKSHANQPLRRFWRVFIPCLEVIVKIILSLLKAN